MEQPQHTEITKESIEQAGQEIERRFIVDEFSVPGLVIAEIEFKSVDDALQPPLPLPFWLGHEVTNRHGWGNSRLARRGLPEDPQPLYAQAP